MKKFLVALITLGLLLAPISAVQAQTYDETLIFLYWPGTYEVAVGEEVLLYHGWGACTGGLVQLYLENMNSELYFNDVLVSAADGKDQYWWEIFRVPNASWGENCLTGNQHTFSGVYWVYPFDTSVSGTYEVQYIEWLDRSIIDGIDRDGDGGPDQIEGGLLADNTLTIIVE